MPSVRTSAKAIIIRDGKLLVTRNRDADGDWFLLPGGGQNHGESLDAALKRECREEIGADVKVGRLVLVRDYIGVNHEFASEQSHVHQLDLMFECELAEGADPGQGSEPDAYQTGVAWLPLTELAGLRLYPLAIRNLLSSWSRSPASNVYLGDVN